jgi:UDP-4-amino-4,6-dideoxy-N-acetyl-beta-L-altrosamine N-acetyltransferase
MLHGKTTRLRALERSDLPNVVQWFNDPRVRENLAMYQPVSLAREERWFEALLNSKTELVLLIEALEERGATPVGTLGLHDIDWKNRHCKVGIAITPTHWDRGYGTDAMRTALNHAFLELGLHRVELEVYTSNPRAIRSYEKLGFTSEGIRRQVRFRHGSFIDVVVMSVLSHEWKG